MRYGYSTDLNQALSQLDIFKHGESKTNDIRLL